MVLLESTSCPWSTSQKVHFLKMHPVHCLPALVLQALVVQYSVLTSLQSPSYSESKASAVSSSADHWVHVGCCRWHSCPCIQKPWWYSKGRCTLRSARLADCPVCQVPDEFPLPSGLKGINCCRRNRCKTQTRIRLLSMSPRISRASQWIYTRTHWPHWAICHREPCGPWHTVHRVLPVSKSPLLDTTPAGDVEGLIGVAHSSLLKTFQRRFSSLLKTFHRSSKDLPQIFQKSSTVSHRSSNDLQLTKTKKILNSFSKIMASFLASAPHLDYWGSPPCENTRES